MNYAIYGLVDSGNDELFYIGLSQQANIRLYQHRQKSVSSSNKEMRIDAIRSAGNKVLMMYIDNAQTLAEITEREKFWIACYIAAGYRLTNGMHHRSMFGGDPFKMIALYPPVPMLSRAQLSSLSCFSESDTVPYIKGDIQKSLSEKGLIRRSGYGYEITGAGRFTLNRYLNCEILVNCT